MIKLFPKLTEIDLGFKITIQILLKVLKTFSKLYLAQKSYFFIP